MAAARDIDTCPLKRNHGLSNEPGRTDFELEVLIRPELGFSENADVRGRLPHGGDESGIKMRWRRLDLFHADTDGINGDSIEFQGEIPQRGVSPGSDVSDDPPDRIGFLELAPFPEARSEFLNVQTLHASSPFLSSAT